MSNAQLCFLVGRMVEPVISGDKPHKTIRIAKRPEYNPTDFYEYALIVRCRDCKHYHATYNGCDEFGDIWHDEYATVDPDGFCAWGERKGDA